MSNHSLELDVLRDLQEEASVIGQLAQDEKGFTAAYEAFRAGDAKAFHAALERLRLLPRCHLVCEWIRIKECIFVCLELCGPPAAVEKPNPRELAEAIVRITGNEAIVRRLAEALEKRDHKAFEGIVAEYKLKQLCHLFCHWLCVVRYRLVCRWMCGLERERPNFVRELQSAGQALRHLLEHKTAFDQAVAASTVGDAEKLGSILRGADLFQFCHFICEWFCSWRCTLVCLTFCRQFPFEPVRDQIREALEFAKATQPLAHNTAQFERLSVAVGGGDAKTYDAILTEFKLQRFCIQLCHWICALRCRRFCTVSCPPEALYPQFTSIGGYDYLVNIQSAVNGNGLTADNRAFFNTLRLNGILTQTLSGQPMEYRFETRPTDKDGNPTGTGSWTPVKPPQIAKTVIGKWERWVFIPIPHIETRNYTVNGVAGPDEVVATISADGWIQVPQENNVGSSTGGFFPNGNMIELITQTLATFAAADETGVVAGNQASHPLVQDVYFGIRMRVRQQGAPGSETDGGTCQHIAIDDTLYNNITLHPYWAGGLQPPGQLAVCSLGVAELQAAPCSLITNSLTVLFTAAHPNLGSVSIAMDGPGGPYNFVLPAIPESGDWYGIATIPTNPPPPPLLPLWSVAGLPPCAYLLTLTVNLLLTDGDNPPDPRHDYIAFCKK